MGRGLAEMQSGTRNRSFGKRRGEQMAIVARDLTDQDIADLAAYYASIEFTVKVPE